MTNEKTLYERPEILKKQLSEYEHRYFQVFNEKFNAFHRKYGIFAEFSRNYREILGDCEHFLDKSKIFAQIYGDLTKNVRNVAKKSEFSQNLSENANNFAENPSFLSNSVLNSKIYSRIEKSVESK